MPLQLLLQVSEAKIAMWEECMQQLIHCVMLSPDMNDMYKTECSTLLRDTLNVAVERACGGTQPLSSHGGRRTTRKPLRKATMMVHEAS